MPDTMELTPREMKVVKLIASGYTNEAIAFKVGVCYETIKSYVKRIRSKIGVGSRTEIATWAGKNGVC